MHVLVKFVLLVYISIAGIKKGGFGPLIRTRATGSAVPQGISDLV